MTKIKTTSAIASGSAPVLSISHDAQAGCLVMAGEESLSDENTVMVSIDDIVSNDPSLAGIETLPENWRAIRSSEQDSWDIGPVE